MTRVRVHPAVRPLGILLLVGTVLAGVGPQPWAVEAAPAAAPGLGIIPGSGPAGQTVTATGSGWTVSNAPYLIFWEFKGGTQLGTFNPSGAGTWSSPITIPGGASAGPHTIIACEGFGGEFEQCASASYTVVQPTPTVTPTRTRTPTPPPGVTPVFILTSTFTPTASATPLSGCIDGITRIYPTNSDDTGGVDRIDLVLEVTRGDPATRVRVYSPVWVGGTGLEELYTQWPDPLPGTTVDAVTSPVDPNRVTLTVRDFPLRLGYNQIKVDLDPTCWRGRATYFQFRNGVEPTPTPRPDACGGLGLGPEAEVFTFEDYGAEFHLERLAREYGVRFEGSIDLVSGIGIEPRSGRRVGASVDAMEFGSAMRPIRMAFDRPLSALGLFVGMQEAIWASGEITAGLEVYGYRGGAGDLVRLGADSTRFAAGPTDVVHCLRFEADPGDLIARAQVEYTDATGNSIAERRLIDDLTVVFAEASLPPDRPPTVEITSPNDGSRVPGATVFLRATIREDREVVRANYQIDGGPETDLGVSPLLTDPTAYFTGVNFGAALLGDGAPHLLTVNAYDSAGQLGTDTVTITLPTPVPSIDVQAVAVELIQVVQCLQNARCMDNSVPMVRGKPTWVRVYVRSEGGLPRAPISGRLCRGRVESCDSGMIFPLNEITPDDGPSPVADDRGDLGSTLNFILPPSWLNDSSLEVTAFVNYLEQDLDEVRTDNNAAQATASVVPPRALTVLFAQVTADGLTPPLSEMWTFADWLARVFPVSRITPLARAPLARDFDLSDASGDGCGVSWSRLIDALRAAYLWSGSGRAYFQGLVPSDANRGGILGCGEIGGTISASVTSGGTRWGPIVAAQELGHNFGRQHATTGCNADNPDPGYPRANGVLDDWGFDTTVRQLYPPLSSYDYMGYCGSIDNTWTSVYTYLALLRTLPVAGAPSTAGVLAAPYRAEGEPSLVGGGRISPEGFTLERGFYRASLAAGIEDGLPVGGYTVRLVDQSQGILFSRDFTVIELSNHEPTDSGHFQLILPDRPETAEVVFLYNGAEIGRVSASPNAPQVQIVQPAGGEDWGASGAHTISWQASDADGDPLRFNVQYSRDGGESWTAIDFDLAGATSLSLDSADLPGGNLLFRVLASDGLNTAVSTTSSPVTVANKPPQMHLASPIDGDWLPAGEAAVFRGYATDFEDVILDDSAFRWTSSLDGDLGVGPTLWGVPLSVGEHRITLTVSDSGGQSASQSVTVRIGGEEQAPARASLGSLVIVLMAAGGVLIAASIGGIVFLLRRGRQA